MADPLTRTEVRALLGEVRERRFADMILHVLDAADRDADVSEQDRGRSSRRSLAEEAGSDVYGMVRAMAESIRSIAAEREEKPGA